MLVQSFSGIRGVFDRDLTDDVVRRYAYVFSEFLRKKLKREPLIVIGCDTRPSSERLKKAVSSPFSDIIDVGVVPIAATELAVREFKADGGIMITASHNEPECNGLKFLDKDGALLRPKDIDSVIKEFERTKKWSEKKEKRVLNKNQELIEKYCEFLKKIVGGIDNKVKVIVDVNGGSGIILKEILRKLDLGNVKIINDKAGEFKRRVEPDEESLSYLKDVIRRENAEFAAGFDSDADRVEILLKDGSLVDGNYLLVLIVDFILEKDKGTVVTNDATSNVVKEVAEGHGCEIKEVEVGEINVVDEMLKLRSPVGGEGSNGGVIIPPSRCRDGILTLLYLLKIADEKGGSLERLIEGLPKYYTIQKKIKLTEPLDRKKIKDYYLKKGYEIRETGGETGGLKILTGKNSFVWFRVSKTEANLLRIIADSDSKTEWKKTLDEATSLVASS